MGDAPTGSAPGSQYKLGGCDVVFPHQAYGVQLSFMSKCVQALEGGRNALLEAPTGVVDGVVFLKKGAVE